MKSINEYFLQLQKYKGKQSLELEHVEGQTLVLVSTKGKISIKGTDKPLKDNQLWILKVQNHFIKSDKKAAFMILSIDKQLNMQCLKDHLLLDQKMISHYFDDQQDSCLALDKKEWSIFSALLQMVKNEKKVTLSLCYSILHFLYYLIEKYHLPNQEVQPEEESLEESIRKYIQLYIYSPQQLQIKEIAGHFGISANYFGTFFRKKFGESFKNYTDNERLSLIETRLKDKNNTLKDIVDLFGFIDESHLSHFFKKKKNITPSEFRKTEE